MNDLHKIYSFSASFQINKKEVKKKNKPKAIKIASRYFRDKQDCTNAEDFLDLQTKNSSKDLGR